MNYKKQAEDFLSKTKTTLTVKFHGKRKYFVDDKEERNTYIFTLKNIKGKYTGTYGDSLNNTEKGLSPSSYDILSCLEKYETGMFADWCDNMGYDTDSKKAENIYYKCLEQYKGLISIFSNNEMEMLREINCYYIAFTF